MRDDKLSTPKEIKGALSRAGSGLLLYSDESGDYYYEGEGHSLILGITGSGKTSCGTLRLCDRLLRRGENLATIDPKGDLYARTAPLAKQLGYRVICVNLRELSKSDCFNPLAAPYADLHSGAPEREERAAREINDIVESLKHEPGNDPFWINSAGDTLRGLIYLLMDFAAQDQVHMAEIYRVLQEGESLISGSLNRKTYFQVLLEQIPKNSLITMNLLSFVTTAADTRGGIRSEMLRMIAMFAQSKGIMELTSHDDLRIHELTGEEKIAIYVVLPDETSVFDALGGILMNALIVHYEGVAHELHGGRLPRRFNFVLEELANVGHAIPGLPKLMAAGRSRNIRVHYVLQSLSQLEAVYKGKAQSILDNTDVTVMFRTNHIDTLETMATLCGSREVQYGDRVAQEPLFRLTDLAALSTGQALIRIGGAVQYVTTLPFYPRDTGTSKMPTVYRKKTLSLPTPFDIRGLVRKLLAGEDALSWEAQLLNESAEGRSKIPSFEEFMQMHRDRRQGWIVDERRAGAERAGEKSEKKETGEK